jgi:hypothetical protein
MEKKSSKSIGIIVAVLTGIPIACIWSFFWLFGLAMLSDSPHPMRLEVQYWLFLLGGLTIIFGTSAFLGFCIDKKSWPLITLSSLIQLSLYVIPFLLLHYNR